MSKITVTTIAGLTSGGDANKVKIESGDDLVVESGGIGIGTTSPTQDLTIVNSGSARMELVSGTSGTSIIDMGDSADKDIGGIRYAQGTDTLQFRAGNDVRMSIDGNGRVTMPSQPAFSATATTTNVPLTTQTTITLSSERFDVGGHLSGNTFTAPVTGKYLFCYLLYYTQLDASHTTLDVTIKTSNKQYQQTWNPSAFMSSDSNFSVSGSVIADMDANDTMFVRTYVAGGAAQTDIHGDSQISGCLLL